MKNNQIIINLNVFFLFKNKIYILFKSDSEDDN